MDLNEQVSLVISNSFWVEVKEISLKLEQIDPKQQIEFLSFFLIKEKKDSFASVKLMLLSHFFSHKICDEIFDDIDPFLDSFLVGISKSQKFLFSQNELSYPYFHSKKKLF